jgi:hypothetical protein
MSSDTSLGKSTGKPALWFWAAAGLGLAWNLFGAVQFIGSLSATPESLQAQGMTVEQAAVMLGNPAWMIIFCAIGVFGGVLGCGLLLLRKAAAVPVFAASLAGYIALYIGDIVHGVFAALGMPQVIVLSAVVLIAAGLLWLARHARAQGLLE